MFYKFSLDYSIIEKDYIYIYMCDLLRNQYDYKIIYSLENKYRL